jgi:tripartite-type tricarboxylate transporter receptor subunit TctC
MKLYKYLAASLITCIAQVGQANADEPYPNKPIRLIVPYTAGGPTDILGRIVAAKIGAALKQTIIVDNKPGANSMIGTAQVARAAADGYTLLLTSNVVVLNEFMYDTPTYNALKDLKPIALVASTPYFLIVNNTLPVHSVAELVAYAKKQPGKLAFGSAGIGGTGQLVGELFQISTGTKLLHVPYKGTGPAMVDLAAGQTQLMFGGLPSAAPFLEQGTLRLLATAESQRSELMPKLPTIKEAGYDGVSASNWFGILGPANLPADITDKISAATQRALGSEDVKKQFAALGAEPLTSTPAKFDQIYRADRERWGKLVSDNKAKFR